MVCAKDRIQPVEFYFGFSEDCRIVSVDNHLVTIGNRSGAVYKIKVGNKKELADVFRFLNEGKRIGFGKNPYENLVVSAVLSEGLYVLRLVRGEKIFASANIEHPINILFRLPKAREYKWNHFISLQLKNESFVLFSTEGFAELTLSDDLVGLLAQLLRKNTIVVSDFENPELLVLLLSLNFLLDTKSDESSMCKYWEWHDRILLSQSRMRSTRDFRRLGATFPYPDETPKPPKIRGLRDIKLLKVLNARLPSFLEKRQSKRIGPAAKPISFSQLSTFLQLLTTQTTSESGYNHRIHAVAGNIGQPEFIVFNNACSGLPRGVYFFDSKGKKLKLIESKRPHIDRIADVYSRFWFQRFGRPQVVIQVIRHYPSIAWKYRGINLKVQLVESGCVLASAQLLASHLGLSCCPLGNGPMNLFKSSTNLTLGWDWAPMIEFTLEHS